MRGREGRACAASGRGTGRMSPAATPHLITICRPLRSPATSCQHVHQGQFTPRPAADLFQCNMWLPVSPEDPQAPLVRGRVNGGTSSRCPSRTPQHTRVAAPAAPSGETRLQQCPPPSSSSKERRGHWPPVQVTVLSPLSIPSCFLSPGNMPCFGLLLTFPFSEFGETGRWPRAGGLTPLGQALVPGRQGRSSPVSVSPEPTDAEGGGGGER